jgi:hypothetical protein
LLPRHKVTSRTIISKLLIQIHEIESHETPDHRHPQREMHYVDLFQSCRFSASQVEYYELDLIGGSGTL